MSPRGIVTHARRGLWQGLVVAGLVLAACAPAAPATTTAPTATSGTAAKPTTPPAATTAPAPAASPAAAAATSATTAAAKPAASPAATTASPSPAAKAITLPQPEADAKRLKMAHSTLETTQLAYAMARDLGIYKKYGFDDVELFFSEGDAKAVQMLFSGAVDLIAGGVSSVISSQQTDVPLITLSMSATTLTDAIVSTADVKTPADLKGKTVGISTFGTTSHGAALLGLQAMGLTDKDVTLTQVGAQSARIAALRAGSVAATVVDVTLEDQMKELGFNILTRLPDSPKEYGRNGLNVRRDWYQKYPNAALALTAASLEGQNAIWTDTEKAIDVFMKWAQVTDRAQAEKAVRDFMKYGRRDMRWNRDGWDLTKEVLASQNPEIANVDVTKAYTLEPLDKLRDMGFYQSLGIPTGR